MIATSVTFRGHRCFKSEWAGFDTIKPVNVIIGRNNTGKSHLLDLAAALCGIVLKGKGWRFKCSGVLDEDTLRRSFRSNTSGGELGGNHWEAHGQRFVGVKIAWEVDEQGNPTDLSFPDGFSHESPSGQNSTNARLSFIRDS